MKEFIEICLREKGYTILEWCQDSDGYYVWAIPKGGDFRVRIYANDIVESSIRYDIINH